MIRANSDVPVFSSEVDPSPPYRSPPRPASNDSAGYVKFCLLYVAGKPPIDDFRTVAHIKTLVHQIYSAMNIEQHQV